jgi:hypothetical protein
MDLEPFIADLVAWSEKTFGPGPRTENLLNHIAGELDEIEAKPADVTEWIDVVMLALDGAYRSGHSPKEICEALVRKYEINLTRKWIDPGDGAAVEHERS